MNTNVTRDFLTDNGIVPLVADLTQPNEQANQLLEQLGNGGKALPFYAIFPGDGSAPIVFSDVPLTQGTLIERLEKAIGRSGPIPSGEMPSGMAVPQHDRAFR